MCAPAERAVPAAAAGVPHDRAGVQRRAGQGGHRVHRDPVHGGQGADATREGAEVHLQPRRRRVQEEAARPAAQGPQGRKVPGDDRRGEADAGHAGAPREWARPAPPRPAPPRAAPALPPRRPRSCPSPPRAAPCRAAPCRTAMAGAAPPPRHAGHALVGRPTSRTRG